MSTKKRAASKRQAARSEAYVEKDSAFFLKLILYVVLGSIWLKFHTPIEIFGVVVSGIPVGLILGLLFIQHDHFQIDRKIEYAVLIIVTIVSYFLPTGIIL